MVVDTIRFNPSVCTCGKHDCKPHYRMERKVRLVNEKQQNGSGEATMKENGDIFDCKVGGAEVNGRDKGEIGAEVNERRCKERFAADENDGKTGVEESNGGLGGIFGNKTGNDRCNVKIDDGKADDGKSDGRCSGRVYSDASNCKPDGRIDCNEGDDRCDDRSSGGKDERKCDGRYDSDNNDDRFDRDDTNNRCNGSTDVNKNDGEHDGVDSSKGNGVTAVDDEVRCDRNFGVDQDNGRYKLKVDFQERNSGSDDEVMITVDGVDESDGKCDDEVGVEFDDGIFDGSVGNHEVEDRGDDKADSRSHDDTVDVGPDPPCSVFTSKFDDTYEIASAFGIMSIYCNSELHSCGRD